MSCEKAGSDTWVALHDGASLKLAREQPIPPASPIRDLMFKVACETATEATQTVMVAGSSQDTEDLKELDCISWSSCGTCAGVAKERQYERKYRKPHTKASEVDLKQFEFQNEQPILPSTVFFFAGPHVSRGTVRTLAITSSQPFVIPISAGRGLSIEAETGVAILELQLVESVHNLTTWMAQCNARLDNNHLARVGTGFRT
ncbi:VID27 cytoplasmic protein [Colletotrichum abscissum]|uniref:VID27 cytoplasmic protein n=1 Tax=Colletotrichum abscissum TaxID=1671311 RepID=A0A9Q0B3A1_9PEZI|nr:VID27 cytoplasmic protein [Colletotrichum abscissum]